MCVKLEPLYSYTGTTFVLSRSMKYLTFIMSFVSFWVYSQNTPSQSYADFLSATARLQFQNDSENVTGEISFDVLITSTTDSLFVDAKSLKEHEVFLNGNLVKSDYNGERILLRSRFRESDTINLRINFTSEPKKAMYFIDATGDGSWNQIWTQGQGKYTSNWLPSIDDMNDKMLWNLQITAPDHLTSLSNGVLTQKKELDNVIQWNYSMDQPMSSYLVAIVIGEYDSYKLFSETRVPIELYYYKGEKNKALATYKKTKEIFDFLEREIGYPYPWQVYRQVPVKDFLYSGMENTGLTVYSDSFFNDEIGSNDRSYVTVNAHEMAHQWFGNLVTETESQHHWLHEGFATYYSMLAEQYLYGDNHFLNLLYTKAEILVEQSRTGKSTELLNPGSSSLTFYDHGAWALHALKVKVGDKAFKTIIRHYLTTNAYDNVTTFDFLEKVTEITGLDLLDFREMWLLNKSFPAKEALQILRSYPEMEEFFQLKARSISNFNESFTSFKEVANERDNIPALIEMIQQLTLHDDIRKYDLIKKVSNYDLLEVNRAIVLSTQQINDYNRSVIQTLIDEPSYVTRESAMFLLWQDTKNKKELLLDLKSRWDTLSPELNMSWLVLALSTPEFTNAEKQLYLSLLRDYTDSKHSMITRQAAFDYLIQLDIMSEENYRDLIAACFHHVWRFYKTSREHLRTGFKTETGREIIKNLMTEMSDTDQLKVERVLSQ